MTTICGAEGRGGRLCENLLPCGFHPNREADSGNPAHALHSALCDCPTCWVVREARDAEADAVRRVLRYHLLS